MMTRKELTKLTDDQGFVIYHEDDATSTPPAFLEPGWNGFASYYPYALFRVDGSFIGVAHDLEQIHRYLINPSPYAWPTF